MDYKEEIGKILRDKKWKISTAESCTGGLLSSKLTDISGSSEYITLNLITYSNEAKQRMLNVTLNQDGAVSEYCACQMAKGLYELTHSEICVSTTGIAGPTGGTLQKPVGLMYASIFSKDRQETFKIQTKSNLSRTEIKEIFTNEVLKKVYIFLKEVEGKY